MGQKPHLLTEVTNNLGAETADHVRALDEVLPADKAAGRPWITRLPFPVHVVERVETLDQISGNRFVTRYAYHHGYFDGDEREFRGFGMVEQWDTEEFATLPAQARFRGRQPGRRPGTSRRCSRRRGFTPASTPAASTSPTTSQGYSTADSASTTASRADRCRGRRDASCPTPAAARPHADEEREACRALKGVDAAPGGLRARRHASEEPRPYTVTEQNFTIQLRAAARRKPARESSSPTRARPSATTTSAIRADPRIGHALTLEVDPLRQRAAGRSRSATAASGSPFRPRTGPRPADDPLITYTESAFTNAIDDSDPDDHRTPLPAETRTFELTGMHPGARCRPLQLRRVGADTLRPARRVGGRSEATRRARPHPLSQGRPDALLPLRQLEPLALPGRELQAGADSGPAGRRLQARARRPRGRRPPARSRSRARRDGSGSRRLRRDGRELVDPRPGRLLRGRPLSPQPRS